VTRPARYPGARSAGRQATSGVRLGAVTSGEALVVLMQSLAERNIRTRGMTLTRRSGWLVTDMGGRVAYWHGYYWWPSGRLNDDRPVYAIHSAADPAGAARRLARAGRSSHAAWPFRAAPSSLRQGSGEAQ
jgi:hypothetical protein